MALLSLWAKPPSPHATICVPQRGARGNLQIAILATGQEIGKSIYFGLREDELRGL
ncbi:MAG TPA: hypothetical protein VGS27_02915 [Candidatus Sulfotelmatobacter sp.]|nr:hypothetical protein [Candidatus Sulfotelmatobacter sp.]